MTALVSLGSLVAGYLVFALVLRFTQADRDVRRFWLQRVLAALVMGVVFAKLTPLWTRWEVVFYNPLLLISMNAGMPGLWGGTFAFFGVVGFSLWQARKANPAVRRGPLVLPLVAGLVLVASWMLVEPLVFPRTGPDLGGATELLVPDFEGRRHALSDWKGKVVVINFWATWCTPCLAELPEFQTFAKSAPPGVVVVGVNLIATENGGQAAVQRFASEHRLSWTQLSDVGGVLQSGFGVRVIPTTVVLGPDGSVVDRREGTVDLFWLRSLEGRFGAASGR